jgi:hypothetical protein
LRVEDIFVALTCKKCWTKNLAYSLCTWTLLSILSQKKIMSQIMIIVFSIIEYVLSIIKYAYEKNM